MLEIRAATPGDVEDLYELYYESLDAESAGGKARIK